MNSRDCNKNLYDIMDMSDDEFTDYMIEEYNKKPSNSEIIMNSGKTIENLVTEINAYHDKLVFLAYKYELSLNNKVAFILKICEQKEHIQELMPLLSCFICKPDYLFEIKNRKASIKNEGRLAEYLLLKEDMEVFERYVDEVRSNTEKYKDVIKKIKLDGTKNRIGMPEETKELLIKFYKEYISEDEPLPENIEYIHELAMETEERRKIYSILVFKFFIQNKTNIAQKPLLINASNLVKYTKYRAINKNNGKNFNTNSKYVKLFLELIDNFSDICDISLCMYVFEKTSNLIEWLFKSRLHNSIFHHSFYSIVESTYGSIFYEESIFWTENNLKVKNYFDFEIQEEDNKGEYLSELIQKKLSDKEGEVLDYLNEYAKSRRHAAKYIKKLAYKVLEINNYRLSSMGDEGYVFLTFERELQEKADCIIKKNIMELLQ